MARTLFEYYQQRGEKLPTVSERAKIFEQRGLGTASEYRGKANQNVALLTSFQQETPAGDISGKLEGTKPSVIGDLSNLRIMLKAAVTEAAQARASARFKQLYPVVGGVPGTMGDIARMIRGSVAPSAEDVFTTIMKETGKTRDFAFNGMMRYPDAGILETDDPNTVTRKISRAPSFLDEGKELAPTQYTKEWQEAGGLEGTGMTQSQWIMARTKIDELPDTLLPTAFNIRAGLVGLTNEQATDILTNDKAPSWFRKAITQQLLFNPTAEFLKEKWDSYSTGIKELAREAALRSFEAGKTVEELLFGGG